MINLYYVLHFLECGHFCINYILRKDHKKRQCSYNKMMMNLSLIRKVLLNYYFHVNCYKNYNIDKINSRTLTMIKTHKNTYHYVVIEKIENNYVFYYDPLFIGLKKAKKSQFIKKWNQIVCKFI